jgi:inhibitor of KinA
VTGDFRIILAGDSTVIVQFEERIDATINARAVRLAEAVETAALSGVRDVVPTYRSVAIYFDPLRTDFDRLSQRLEAEAAQSVGAGSVARAPTRVPVCYGGEFGPDLAEVAAFAHMTDSDVIAAHSSPVYRVFMMGFVPGFTYLGTVDTRIAAPRRVTPRLRVPAGSVGIAGQQTGIYPMETPGGWQIVGRTPMRTFDLSRRDPFQLKTGDLVQFYSIEPGEYERQVV